VTASPPHVEAATLADGSEDASPALTGTTTIWIDGAEAIAGRYDRTALRAGNVVAGPAIVTEMDATTLVLPEHSATVDPRGNPHHPTRRCLSEETRLGNDH